MVKSTKLQAEVRRRINRFNTDYNKKLTVTAIDSALNEALEIWLENRSSLFETNANVRRDLMQLEVKNFKLKTLSKFSQDSIKAELPPDLFKITRRFCTAYKEGCGKKTLNLVAVQTDDLTEALKSPYLSPSFEWEETLFDDYQSSIIVYHKSSFEVQEVFIDYVKTHPRIQTPSLTASKQYVDSEGNIIKADVGLYLDNNYQYRKICDITALICLRDLGDIENYQTQINKILASDSLYMGVDTEKPSTRSTKEKE